MDKTFFEELEDARKASEPTYVCFYNNGNVKEDELSVKKRMNDFYLKDTIDSIKYVFRSAAESYSRNYPYDSITMNLEVGLIYNKSDVDEENNIREGAKPIENVVRCYTGDIDCYLAGEKTNEVNYWYSRQGFVSYDKLISTMKKNGIQFVGPETYEEFKEAILTKEPFDVSITADFNKKEEQIQEVKETPKTKKLGFPFGKKRS